VVCRASCFHDAAKADHALSPYLYLTRGDFGPAG
jgi:hypothetical protein